MLTRIAPIRAAANWVMVHCAQFGAQIPTRSPTSTPAAISALASRSTSASNSRQVQRDPLATSRSEEHTSELQSLMRISYAVFCLKKKQSKNEITHASHKETVNN